MHALFTEENRSGTLRAATLLVPPTWRLSKVLDADRREVDPLRV